MCKKVKFGWMAIAPSTLARRFGDGRLHLTMMDVGQGDALLVTFPNGRTLTDDVVDIELSVVGLSDGTFEGLTTSGISDGVNGNDLPFQDSFPFVSVPHAGFDFNPDSDGD